MDRGDRTRRRKPEGGAQDKDAEYAEYAKDVADPKGIYRAGWPGHRKRGGRRG